MARRILYSVDNKEIDETIKLLNQQNVTFGILDYYTKEYIHLLKDGEYIEKQGLHLYIQPGRITASLRMQELSNNPNGIRWINELYFRNNNNL